MRPPTDRICPHAARRALARARSTAGQPDAVVLRSACLRKTPRGDSALTGRCLIRGTRRRPFAASWLTLPLEVGRSAIGSLAIAAERAFYLHGGSRHYGPADRRNARPARRRTGAVLQNERDRRRRIAVPPRCRGARCSLDGSLNIFHELGRGRANRTRFRPHARAKPIGASGTLHLSVLLVGDVPADLQPEHRLEYYSFRRTAAAK